MGSYAKPTKPAYGKPSKPAYGGDNSKPKPPNPTLGDIKPPPSKPYNKPTPAPYKPKPTTAKPYKPTTEKPKPYKPTTEKPYKPTTEKPKPTPYKPKPTKPYGGGGKPNKSVLYKPVAGCPWETNHGFSSYAGDCPGHENKCNLKYFRVCGESFFNKVYNDVCKWQDAKQLIPMFTEKLVPLGAKFENKHGVKCNGLNKEGKSLQELFGGQLPTTDRDVPQCKPIAGAVPCELINFHGVTHAREFHHKVEALYHEYLINHCNKEWQVHFEALLKRMRNSLFCDDGGHPDHDGYVVSPPPPTYNNKPKPPTPAPYKPKPPKPTSYKPDPPKPTPYKPKPPKPTSYKPKPPKPTSYGGNNNTPKPYKPPSFKPNANCPWEQNGNYANYGGDCPGHNGLCNLKYFEVCGETFFNKVYNDVCHWQDAAQLIPMITQKLVPLGAKFENVNDVKCNGLNKEGKSIQILLGSGTSENDRDVPQCKAAAGAVPCQYIDFTS